MTDELEHVIRSRPPWRRGEDLTECGKPKSAVTAVITRDSFVAKVRKQGQQRSAMTTCMTCWQTATRYPDWEQNPVSSLIREAQRFRWQRPGQPGRDVTFHDELLAIAALIDAHGEEFDELLSGLGDTVRLDEKRRQRKQARNT